MNTFHFPGSGTSAKLRLTKQDEPPKQKPVPTYEESEFEAEALAALRGRFGKPRWIGHVTRDWRS
jgi:hypothetical protein